MKKTSESAKFPTFRGQIEKRTSAFDPLLSTSKPDSGQELSVEFVGQMSSTQVEVAKRIQNRLRMRKATGSEKRINREPIERGETCEKIQDSCETDLNEDFESKVEHLWENSEDVGNMVNCLSSFIEPHELKKRLLKESGIIQCQVLGQNMENLILARLKKLGELAKSEQRCRQRVDNMQKMLEERMKKLGNILKSR